MKLYYSPGACSLAVHIALVEAGIPFDAIKVDLKTHQLASGEDYRAISPRGYVPLIELDDGSRHTEAAALLQYVGDLDARGLLMPRIGTVPRLAVIEWLTFVSTELHKTFSPWLFHEEVHASARELALARLHARFSELDEVLASRDYLSGSEFTVADAYCFTVVNWSRPLKIDLASYPNLKAYMTRVSKRPKVRETLIAEGLVRTL
ncbi:glutathione transferase GstA [Trinickia caryophylli]|uniref:Glutathione S-transferase n=1 Tax=Trinickia caryophylli TaxID=28094 RepID=A0A1X7DYA5_TRICW|nr:glutathione transferase GstA [Trinickia caryophylli]PMS14313.1 glutathione transferase GstA [Trinickia caryophylli]TRX17888.1 glutathione transferase GstA [Trinickia caryophylli]WQE11341.1 glutathione transferase GstA [Trinickia caryophylli]SMF23407.1 glutathione S-transferase [Trinickia caryophylli]GLU32497.1 glutathione S-transferase [Trinickia caryophylli]